ncbi:hypothetical protein C1X05_07465 [Laceyella sacchari]|nr:hypothetical protein C1X05_07465 [Laceyella sacchari]
MLCGRWRFRVSAASVVCSTRVFARPIVGSTRTTMCIDCGSLSTFENRTWSADRSKKNGRVSAKPPLGAGGALVRKETGKVDHSQRSANN